VFFIEAFVIACRVVPIQEFVKIIKQFSVFLVGMMPLFDFPIGLGMLDSGQDMFDFIFRKECIESTLRIPIFIGLVCEELRSMIRDYLLDPPNIAVGLKRHSHQVDASFASCRRKLSALKNKSRAIVEDHTVLFAIDSARVPIKVNCSETVLSLVSDPGLPAFLLFLVLIGHSTESACNP
jgi:hypothetical protein